MTNNKSLIRNKIEYLCFTFILFLIVINAILRGDSVFAFISAVCGITYTALAGKGLPICYIFGVIGSSFYGLLSFQNALWGNLLLYVCYYVPMQITGYFQWNKNLKEGKSDIVKIVLPKKELFLLLLILLSLSIIGYYILLYFKDSNPLLDSLTTVLSIGGMYLTVRRAIEQWIFWFVVNILSLYMWVMVVLSGVKAYSTVAMWLVYTVLAIYFYYNWRKEIISKYERVL